MSLPLRNPFWRLDLNPAQPQLTALAFDAAGQSQWCPNLLKTSAPVSHLSLTGPTGAQSAYVDAAGTWQLSSSAPAARVNAVSESEVEIAGIDYGHVSERWRLRLDGPRLTWTITQTWREETVVADALAPGLFFSGQVPWGEPTVFVWWERGMAKDGFYGSGSILGPDCVPASSRQTRIATGGWAMAKLLSHACPNGDLRVTASHHLKKGEILNFSSVLGQSPWCDAQGPRTFHARETMETTLTLEPVAAATGIALDVRLSGPLQREAAVSGRFFDSYANCGIMADTDDWRLGNEPSGYVALMCRYMHAEMLKLGVRRGALGADSTDVQHVLVDEVTRMADHLVQHGTVGPGYQSDSGLDFHPSYLLCIRDVLLITGDRALGARLWAGARVSIAKIAQQCREGGGLIHTTHEAGNDYWDWISRTGHIGYVNILAWWALRAAREVAEWLGHTDEAAALDTQAAAMAEKFNADFWSEGRGYYADWIDLQGRQQCYLYAGPQLMAICAGLVPPARARRIVEAILARRKELGPAWENCFSLQTNFYDAEEHSFMKRNFNADVTRFGETMNGGCLASWNYYWIGALVKVGRADLALSEWKKFMHEAARTSLYDGCNYWDFKGQPSRTVVPAMMIPKAFPAYEPISAEPFLADQGLVGLALPRWLLGIESTFAGLTVNPVLPESALPATARVIHLGQERELRIK